MRNAIDHKFNKLCERFQLNLRRDQKAMCVRELYQTVTLFPRQKDQQLISAEIKAFVEYIDSGEATLDAILEDVLDGGNVDYVTAKIIQHLFARAKKEIK